MSPYPAKAPQPLNSLTTLAGRAIPYLGRVAPTVMLVMVAAALAGYSGLAAQIEPLLLDARFNNAILVTAGVWLTFLLMRGTVATTREGSEIDPDLVAPWLPVKTVLLALVLIPFFQGTSLAAHFAVGMMKLGAGL